MPAVVLWGLCLRLGVWVLSFNAVLLLHALLHTAGQCVVHGLNMVGL
jgi:hypothetical protein